MGNTLKSAKLFVCFVAALAVPWFVNGEDDHGHSDEHGQTTVDQALDGDAPSNNSEGDSLSEDTDALEQLSELIDSRMPESGEKLRLSVSADHPITSETHGYEEGTFIDVSFPPGGSVKPTAHGIPEDTNAHDRDHLSEHETHLNTHGDSHAVETHSAAAVGSHDVHTDSHHEMDNHRAMVEEEDHHIESSHGHSAADADASARESTVHLESSAHHGEAHDHQQLPFPHAAELSYNELSDQLHDHTFELIKAEIRGDAELMRASIYEMTHSLQAIIDRASHAASPERSEVVDSAARGMAIHLDRIDFALSQEDMRKVSLLVGKVAAKVKELEVIMETERGAGDRSDHTAGSNEHHDDHGSGGHDSHAGVHP